MKLTIQSFLPIQVLLVSFGLAFSNSALPATPQCPAAHLPIETASPPKKNWKRSDERLPLQNELDPAKLAKSGFALSPDKKQLINLNGMQPIGEVYVIQAEYLFQWGTRENHKVMLEDRGITSDYMKSILEEPGQAAGKGFYVSLDPIDSISYGDSVTQFKTQGPLVVLSVGNSHTSRVMSDTTFVQKLAEAGIDALSHAMYTKTWLSMIHNRRLQGAGTLSSDVIAALVEDQKTNVNTRSWLSMDPRKFPMELWHQWPADDPLGKLARGESMSWREVKGLSARPEVSPLLLAKRYADFALRAKMPEELTQIIHHLRSTRLGPEHLHELQKSVIPKSRNAKTQIYRRVLDIYDMKTVATSVEAKRTAEPITLEKMKAATQDYSQKRKSVRLRTIKSVDDLVKTAENLYGRRYHIRNYSVIMTDNTKKFSDSIELHPQVLANLKSHPMLGLNRSQAPARTDGNAHYHVEYFNLDRAPRLLNLLSPELTVLYRKHQPPPKSNGAPYEREPYDETKPAAQKLLHAVLKEHLDLMLSHPEDLIIISGYGQPLRRAQDFYYHFMGLHPFTDGNGRMGRLIYEVLAEKERADGTAVPELHLPFYDLDLFIPPHRYDEFNAVGTVLKAWVLEAKDDFDFLNRSRWALEVFFRVYPEYRSTFPEVRSF